MPDEGPCCGFKKKTVVMTCIGLCCLTLVVWTVIITATAPIEQTSMLNSTNTTTNSTSMVEVCVLNSSLPIEMVSMSLSRPINETNQMIKKIKIGSSKTQCKCLCQLNVTDSEIIEALKEVRIQRNLKKKAKVLWFCKLIKGAKFQRIKYFVIYFSNI